MNPLLKSLGYAVLVTLLGVYAFLELTGPSGVRALKQKRQRVQQLQEGNAELQRDIRMRKDRIQRLLESREEQELEIRRRFKLQKKGTVDFYLPPGDSAPPAAGGARDPGAGE